MWQKNQGSACGKKGQYPPKVEAGIAQIGIGLPCQYIIMIGPPNQGHGFLKGKRFKTFGDNNVMLSNIVHGVEKPFH